MRLWGTVTALAVVAVALAGCSGSGDFFGGGSGGGSGSSSAVSTPTPSVTAPPRVKPNFMPTYDPASAAANQRLFMIVMEQGVVAEGIGASAAGQADRLAAVGFDPGGIQWTDNSTAIGLLSDSVYVSAQVGDQCLVGQYGPAIDTVTVAVEPALASGGCLVGAGINRF